jgi:poly(A) polymerase
VRFADARADALRRDFTINGMFLDPETDEVFDFVGGRKDLDAKVIRTIGDPAQRFREDRLRLLRAVRFATVLGFVIEPNTMAAMRRHADGISDVSAERIREELTRMLVSGSGGRGLGLLHEADLLHRILPEVAAMDGVAQPPQFHPEGDVFTHTRMLLDSYESGGEAVALAALLHDIGKPPTAGVNDKGRIAFPKHASVGAEMAEDVMQRLRYPSKLTEQVRDLVKRHMDWPSLPLMRTAKQRRFLLRPDLELHLELHRLDCEACHRDLSLYDYARVERQKLLEEPPPIRPILSGHDLKTMGFAPGPGMGVILEALVDAQLEKVVGSPAEARQFVLSRFSPPDGEPLAEQDRS